jgi:hypothetical protein
MSDAASAPGAFTATTSFAPRSCQLPQRWMTYQFLVVALTEMVMPDAPSVSIVVRPILIVEGAPDRIIVVDGDRIIDLESTPRRARS